MVLSSTGTSSTAPFWAPGCTQSYITDNLFNVSRMPSIFDVLKINFDASVDYSLATTGCINWDYYYDPLTGIRLLYSISFSPLCLTSWSLEYDHFIHIMLLKYGQKRILLRPSPSFFLIIRPTQLLMYLEKPIKLLIGWYFKPDFIVASFILQFTNYPFCFSLYPTSRCTFPAVPWILVFIFLAHKPFVQNIKNKKINQIAHLLICHFN